MKENIKISVIVTIHNSEKYLEQCLDSVCQQSLKEIEILCIDGGSTDTSPEILRIYQERDSRIKIINDSNTSYGHKINVGVQYALGEYIGILETDDCMMKFMLERLYCLVKKYNLDYADSDYNTFFEEDNRIFCYGVKKYGTGDCYDCLLDSKMNIDTLKIGGTGAIWTGIYRKQFLLDKCICMFESPGAAYQDTSFRYLVTMLADSCYHLSERLYQYRSDNTGSSIKDSRKIYTIAEEYEYLKKQLNRRKIQTEGIWRAYYQWKYEGYYWNAFRLAGDARNIFLEKYRQELTKDIQKGYLKRNCMSEIEFRNTFLLIEDSRKFMECVEKNAAEGNLSFIFLSEIVRKIGVRKIVVFGSGIHGRKFLELYQNYPDQILCFCDNSATLHNTEVSGYKVLSVEEAVQNYPEAFFVIANVKHRKQMKEQLLELNISSDRTCFY